MKDSRQVEMADGTWEKVSWDQDGLAEKWDQLFRKDAIPKISESNSITRKVLESNSRIKNPKPDIVFGLQSKTFSANINTVNAAYAQFTEVCPGVWFPFLIVETAKKKPIKDAILQCARGGAAVINAMRKLNHISGGRDLCKPGADYAFPALSLACNEDNAVLQFHWALVTSAGETIYQMHRVHGYFITNPGVPGMLRHGLNNILDWGTLNRKLEVDMMMNRIEMRMGQGNLIQLPTRPEIFGEAGAVAAESEDDQDELGA